MITEYLFDSPRHGDYGHVCNRECYVNLTALQILQDLVKLGEHEGPCDPNSDDEGCSKHIEASNVRLERAKDYLSRL